jgi:hypothetical protein
VSDNETKGWSGAITMAVQQLGPEASRAGARRARALAARAGGPTAALVALSTVTVTSLVAIAFAPLPHSVSPVAGGGVAAPTNVRSIGQKPAPTTPPVKKPGTGSAFTGNPPAAGTSTSTRTTTRTTTRTSGGGSSAGGGNHGGNHGGGGGNTPPPRGTGSGGVLGGGGGTGTEGQGQLCPPLLRETSQCASPGTNFGGGGHIIVIPPPPINSPVVGGPEGTGTQGSGSTIGGGLGTNPGTVIPPTTTPTGPTGGGTNGSGESGGPAAQVEQIANTIARALGGLVTTKPNGHVLAPVPSTNATPASVKTTATSVNKSDVTAHVKAECRALVAATTTQAESTDHATQADRATANSTHADQAEKHLGKHRAYGEHRAGGKHRA